jgi:membrane protein implicated in regulation of membrane protease activity
MGWIGEHIDVIWLVAGLALCAAETLVPGAFLIFIGAAAVVVGVVELFFPLTLTPQLMLFAALVVAFVLIGRDLYGSLEAGAPPLPLSRAHEMIGQTFYLDEPIQRGFGRMRVGDSVWRVAGDDLPAGAKVRVVSIEDGSLVRVEQA